MPGSELSGVGSPSRTGRPRHRSRLSRAILPTLVLAIVIPYMITLFTLWARTGDDQAAAQDEKRGLTIGGPLIELVSISADAQSAATAGRALNNDQLTAAIKKVDAANAQVGDHLGTSSRWADVRNRLTQVIGAHTTGADGYSAFTEVVDQELALLQSVVDSSGLALDPQTDSHFLMTATVEELPGVLRDAGRTADLALLTEQHKATGKIDPLSTSVAQIQVNNEITAIDDALSKSFAAATSRTTGPAVLSQLDQLRSTGSVLAPPVLEVGSPVTTRPAADVATARGNLRNAALALQQVSTNQLGLLLDKRIDGIANVRLLAVASTVLGLLLAGGMSWLRVFRRRPAPQGDLRQDGEAPEPMPTAPPRQPLLGTPVGSLDEAADLLAHTRDVSDARSMIKAGRSGGAGREQR